MLQIVLATLLGYALGAIPTGAIVARVYGGVRLTEVGSKRTGATNVLRTLGPGAAAIVFLGDFLKGSAAVLLGGLASAGDPWAMGLGGLAAVLGHAYSPFLGFKGGRGVVTGLAALAVLAPVLAGLAFAVGAVVIAATRYVSLGSILGTAVGTLGLLVLVLSGNEPVGYIAFALGVGGFIVAAHHDNIGRLVSGTERKLGERVERTS